MPTTFDSAEYHDTFGVTFNATPTLITWTETYTWFGESNLIAVAADPLAPDFALMEAYLNNTELIYPGAAHKKYPNSYAMDVKLMTVAGDKDPVNLRQMVTYIKPGDYSSVEYDAYQTQISTSFAADNTRALRPYNLTVVPYHPTNPLLQTNIGVPFVASIKIPDIVQSMRVTQWEPMIGDNAAPAKILGEVKPFWNKDAIWGCDPAELLWVGTKSSSEGTPLHRRTYTFLRNRFKWSFFYALYQDARGLTPPDITPINPSELDPEKPSSDVMASANGAGAFKMLLGKSFADTFGHLKKPFNTGATAGNPPAGQLGDFPVYPNDLA